MSVGSFALYKPVDCGCRWHVGVVSVFCFVAPRPKRRKLYRARRVRNNDSSAVPTSALSASSWRFSPLVTARAARESWLRIQESARTWRAERSLIGDSLSASSLFSSWIIFALEPSVPLGIRNSDTAEWSGIRLFLFCSSAIVTIFDVSLWTFEHVYSNLRFVAR